MNTIVTATKHVVLPQATVLTVLRHATGWLYTTYETYGNFVGIAINRPESNLMSLLAEGRVDKVIQVCYTGRKTKAVRWAEANGVDVVLIRSAE